jgi:cysteine desulfurase
LRDRLEDRARAIAPDVVVIAANAARLPNTSNLALPGTGAETILIALDLAGIAVSAGAACSSGKVAASHVLAAMGLAPGIARAAIRVSLGRATRAADIEAFLDAWSTVAARRSRLVA